MTGACFSSLPSLEIEIVGKPPDRKINVSEKTHFSLRIVEDIRFRNFFFHFHVVTVVLLYISGYNNYFFGLALSKYLWKH